jgi:hypothetical protein
LRQIRSSQRWEGADQATRRPARYPPSSTGEIALFAAAGDAKKPTRVERESRSIRYFTTVTFFVEPVESF